MNAVPQNALPLPVQQAAYAQQLGAFNKIYAAAIVKSLIAAGVFLLFAGFFLFGGILPADETVMTRVILVGFGLFFLGFAIYVTYSAIQIMNQRIYLFQNGMIVENHDQLQLLPWNQIVEVWQRVTRNYTNGIYTGTTYFYTLRRGDGYTIKLDNRTRNIAELGPAISQGITRELVPRALNSLRAGHTLPFGSFTLSQQGVAHGREFLPWSQIRSVTVNRGFVSFYKVDSKRGWKMTSVAKIPNFLVFLIVSEEMIRQR